jgi:hypothetical protein
VAEYLQAHTGGSFTGSLNFDVNANNPFDSKDPFSNTLLGNFQSYQEVNRRVDYDPINHVFEWYVQDNWKVSKRLTLDYGVRFTVDLPQVFESEHSGEVFGCEGGFRQLAVFRDLRVGIGGAESREIEVGSGFLSSSTCNNK